VVDVWHHNAVLVEHSLGVFLTRCKRLSIFIQQRVFEIFRSFPLWAHRLLQLLTFFTANLLLDHGDTRLIVDQKPGGLLKLVKHVV